MLRFCRTLRRTDRTQSETNSGRSLLRYLLVSPSVPTCTSVHLCRTSEIPGAVRRKRRVCVNNRTGFDCACMLKIFICRAFPLTDRPSALEILLQARYVTIVTVRTCLRFREKFVRIPHNDSMMHFEGVCEARPIHRWFKLVYVERFIALYK